jgi:predicted membrane-bound spermidine synthase
VVAIFIGYYYMTRYTFLSALTQASFAVDLHPFFKIPNFHSIKGFLKDSYLLVDVFFWPMVFVLIPTILMGASFPLISFLALSRQNKEGKTVGTVYFFNTSGNVLGGIVTGFLLLPYIGTELTLLGFSLTGLFLGLFVSRFGGKQILFIKRISLVIILSLFSIFLFPKDGQLYDTMHIAPGNDYESFFEEGRDGTIMTYQYQEEVWNYINGLTHGGRPSPGTYYHVIDAMSYVPKIENVLIIGYGTGSTTETVLKNKDIKKVTLVELNKTLIKNLKKLPVFDEMLNDNRLNIIIDDGRRFLLQSNEKYDLICIDALRLTTSYSNNLYSRQFFVLINQHLTGRGIFMVATRKNSVVLNTVLSVFEHVQSNSGVSVASNMPFDKNMERRRRMFESYFPAYKEDILRIDSERSRYIIDTKEIEKRTIDYPINEDWKPITEYFIGLKVKEKLFFYQK